jgi:RND superfamily putative drug exporter
VVTLAPASISLMGEAAWWLPRSLDRLLPHINIEGEGPPSQPTATPTDESTAPPSGEPEPGPASAPA